ncbi:hypothetical protein [Adhaeribacter aquaticus]|uniref:hypothetical protein n=1 Tax=Adhaeribacter aquaticus TaxID=299567 RepID=UPI000401C7AA|nr:hypothetical protein [Adhaeribacter aquaticus]
MNDLLILTKEEYEEAARKLEELKNAPLDSDCAKELKVLTKAIVEFERRNLPIPDPEKDSLHY